MPYITTLPTPSFKITKGSNKIDTNSDYQFLAIEATIEASKQDSDKKHNETNESIKQLTETLNRVLLKRNSDQNNISKSSPSQKDTMTLPDPTTTNQTNTRAPP